LKALYTALLIHKLAEIYICVSRRDITSSDAKDTSIASMASLAMEVSRM